VIVWCLLWNEYAWYVVWDNSLVVHALNSEGELLFLLKRARLA